jgi:hypothetical protein
MSAVLQMDVARQEGACDKTCVVCPPPLNYFSFGILTHCAPHFDAPPTRSCSAQALVSKTTVFETPSLTPFDYNRRPIGGVRHAARPTGWHVIPQRPGGRSTTRRQVERRRRLRALAWHLANPSRRYANRAAYAGRRARSCAMPAANRALAVFLGFA